eukprot:TRINITY_DN3002_c0_g1_i1.p4 TRINITY_DN3002_c0_g1~~TRINITY_DN3002_c0_g1_i1.p4  ORF type:complete len:193 (-),score=107.64 TRINITY_DN3002_c0_g1_i1:2-580(-)
MERSVFVGNLAYAVTDNDLMRHVASPHVVSAKVACMPDGRSRGYGIVEYSTADAAAEAIVLLNDTLLNDRPMFVREDRGRAAPPAPAARSQQQRQQQLAVGPLTTPRIFVGNLAFSAVDADVKRHFDADNDSGVVSAEVLMRGGRSRGCAIVEFASIDAAQAAIDRFTESELLGRKIFCREDRPFQGRQRKF